MGRVSGIDSIFAEPPIYEEPPISEVALVLHEPCYFRVLEENKQPSNCFSLDLQCMEKFDRKNTNRLFKRKKRKSSCCPDDELVINWSSALAVFLHRIPGHALQKIKITRAQKQYVFHLSAARNKERFPSRI